MGTEMDTSGNRTALGVSSDVAQLVGERLRHAREGRGQSTSALSAKIKVREHYLVAIENGQWDELPPGLNGRGLVRIYARELSVSVTELDQAANQAVMPAEHDAQAPYQLGKSREPRSEREFGAQRMQPAAEPIISRAVESPKRTNALSGATAKPKPSTETNTVNRTLNSKGAGQSTAHIALTPEELPIDVTTPDVASILGISLDMFDESSGEKTRPQTGVVDKAKQRKVAAVSRGSHSEEEVLSIFAAEAAITPPEVSEPTPEQLNITAAPVAQESEQLQDAPVSTTEVLPEKVESSAVATASSEAVEASPAVTTASSEAVEASPAVTTASSEAVEASPAVTTASSEAVEASPALAPASSEAVEASPAVTTASSEAAQAPILNEDDQAGSAQESSGVAAAEAYLKSHAPSLDQSVATPEQPVIADSKKLRWAVGLLAACVGVLIVGRSLLSDSEPTIQDEAAMIAAPSASTDNASTEMEAESVGTPQVAVDSLQVTEPAEPVGLDNSQAESATETSSAGVESSAEMLGNEGTDANSSSSASELAKAEDNEPPSVDESSAVDSPATTSPSVPQLQGTSSATLKLTESVDIQLTVDGTRVFSGRHEAGDIDLKFDKRLEIFVQDGSKAVLSYSGWNHGALGQAGRKRRIVLNAGSFE